MFTSSAALSLIILFSIHVLVETAAAFIIYKNHNNDRARKFIFTFFITSAIASFGELLMLIFTPSSPNAYKLIDPIIILPGFLIFALLLFYCVELLRPFWLNIKRVVLILLPWMIFTLALGGAYLQNHHINAICTLEQLWDYILYPDVLIRWILVLLFIPYAIWLFFIDFNWRYTSASRRTTNIVVAMSIILCFTYIGCRGLQFFYAYIAHEFIYILLTLFLIRFECKERIHRVSQHHNNTTPDKPQITVPKGTMEFLSHAMEEVINNPDVWQNPDITINDIARIVGTNRTYLQVAAKQKGYASVMDMIHHVRIEYVCQQLRTVSSPQIQNIFYDAGYRSRTTAWRNFVNIMGCTPTEFEKPYLSTPPHRRVIK